MNERIKELAEQGNQFWLSNGLLHRTDGPAVVETDGYQAWYVNGRRHRTDGPAVIFEDGTQWWYVNGKRHRTDGPALILADGTQEWYVNGKDITLAVEKWMKSREVSWPFSNEETSTELKNQLTCF